MIVNDPVLAIVAWKLITKSDWFLFLDGFNIPYELVVGEPRPGSITIRVQKKYEPSPVSVVLAVRDEEVHVGDRLKNLLGQDFPAEMIEIVVVSDGSTDRTVEIARNINDPRVKIVELAVSGGKASAINAAMEQVTNDIIVFADARQTFSENAFAELTAMFQDSEVGAVSGELIIRQGTVGSVREGVGLYWRYEKLIRRMVGACSHV